jgi:hypothetical protein
MFCSESGEYYCGMLDTNLIRFVTGDRHPPYGYRTGVFKAAYTLWRRDVLARPKQDELRTLLDWFNDHLAKPARLTRSQHPRAKNTAVSWVRASAHEHIAQLRRLVTLVEAGGIEVDELQTKRPGYVVYEDDQQVVALPFADTPR